MKPSMCSIKGEDFDFEINVMRGGGTLYICATRDPEDSNYTHNTE